MSRKSSTILPVTHAPPQGSQDQLPEDTVEGTHHEALNTDQSRDALLENLVNDETAKFPSEGADGYFPIARAYDHPLAEAAFQDRYTSKRMNFFFVMSAVLVMLTVRLMLDLFVRTHGTLSTGHFGLFVIVPPAVGLCVAALVIINRKALKDKPIVILYLCFFMMIIILIVNGLYTSGLLWEIGSTEWSNQDYFSAGLKAAICLFLPMHLLARIAAPVWLIVTCSGVVYAFVLAAPTGRVHFAMHVTLGCVAMFALEFETLKEMRRNFEREVLLHRAMNESTRRQLRIQTGEQQKFQIEIELKKQQSATMAHEALLKMLSHDFKGTVLNLEAEVVLLNCNGQFHTTLLAELHHIMHSITSINHRCTIAPMAQESDSSSLLHLQATLKCLFPEVEFHVLDLDVAIAPCLLHLVLHQIFRNARVHGGGGCVCSVTTEGGFVDITTNNFPGQNHATMVAAGSDAMALALSGNVGVVSSSGLGLVDISQILKKHGGEFSIDWTTKDVVARVRLPIVAKPSCIQASGAAHDCSIRVCVVDDQLGARMTAPKLIKLFHPDYKTPKKLHSIKASWEDELVKVGGATFDEVRKCVEWVNTTQTEAARTVVFLDRMLEYPGNVVDGLSLLPELTTNGAVVVMRSGNDNDTDRRLYTEQGAFGTIGKVLHGANDSQGIVTRAKQKIWDQHDSRLS